MRTLSASGAKSVSGSKIASWRKQERRVLVGGFEGSGRFQVSVEWHS